MRKDSTPDLFADLPADNRQPPVPPPQTSTVQTPGSISVVWWTGFDSSSGHSMTGLGTS